VKAPSCESFGPEPVVRTIVQAEAPDGTDSPAVAASSIGARRAGVVALRHRFARERDEQCAEQPRGSMRALGRASSKRHLAERVGFEPTVRLPVHMISSHAPSPAALQSLPVKRTISSVMEIVFVVQEDPDGGLTARALGQSIFTEADTIEELRDAVRDAVRCHFEDPESRPRVIRLHRLHEEVFAA
jgi:hypothetical protein